MTGVTGGCRHRCTDRLCVFSCDSIPPGDYTLQIAPEVQRFAAQALQKNKEYGGKLAIDVQAGLLRLGGGGWGKLDSVNIPHAVYEFHTHPGRCDADDDDCALDMPSEADMELVARDGIQGCFGHFVFAHHGAYLVTLEPDLRLALMAAKAGGKRMLNAAMRKIKKGFENVQDEFERGLQNKTTTLAAFRQRWLQYAAEQGFRARFFPQGQVPTDMLIVRDVPLSK